MLHWRDVRSRVRDYFGYRSRLVWKVLYPNRGHASWGLWGLDQSIIKTIDKKNGFYIELGANNGFTQSNTLWLEMFHGWEGVLIEPISTNYEECVKNRSSRRNKIFRAACVSEGYGKETIELSFFDQDIFTRLWASPLGINSTVEDPLLHGRANSIHRSNEHFKIEEVPARTLTSILSEAGAPSRIDFMSLDVEGGKIEVLKGIDFEHYKIEWICVETRDFHSVEALLTAQGYVLYGKLTHHDYMFKLAK